MRPRATRVRCATRTAAATAEDGAPQAPLVAAPPTLGERRTLLAVGETEAQTVLYNTGDGTLVYRLAAAPPALTLDTAPQALAPGEEATLVVTIDLAALAPVDRVLPVQLITSGGGHAVVDRDSRRCPSPAASAA
jgi:hypothetical protein